MYWQIRASGHFGMFNLIVIVTHWVNRIVVIPLLLEHPISVHGELFYQRSS